MTLDGLLTFLTLIVGALTFMSPVARLRIRLELGLWILWSAFGLTLAIYMEFFQVLAPTCPNGPAWLEAACRPFELAEPGDAAATAMTPQQAAFLVVLSWLVLTGLRLRRPRVHGWSLPTLSHLVVRLVHERKFAQLVDLIEPNLEKLDHWASRRGSLQRLHDALTPRPWEMSESMKAHLLGKAAKRAGGEAEALAWPISIKAAAASKVTLRERLVLRFGRVLSRVVPSGDRAEEAAGDVLRTMLTRHEIVDYVADERPAFGARLLTLEQAMSGDFPDRFLARMIERPGSALYQEIENSQNLLGCCYTLATDAWILHALLDDAQVAYRLHAYDPVPNRLLAMLDPAIDPGYAASLNRSWDYHFSDSGIWRDPTFTTIRYIDLIMRAAACQGVPDHMWVYYLDNIAAAIEKIYDEAAPGIDHHAEWPIRAARMLYAIVDLLVDLVKLVRKLPAGSPHLIVEEERIDRGTSSIPKAAAVTLGDVMKTVVTSERIPDRLKVYLLDVAIRWLRDWGKGQGPDWVRPTVIAAVANGGTIDAGDDYRAALCELYEEVDRPWLRELTDFEAAIGFPRTPPPLVVPPVRPAAAVPSAQDKVSFWGQLPWHWLGLKR